MNDIVITVDKADLLKVLRQNRETHGIAFASAWDGYTKMARAELEEKLARIKAGKPIDPFLGHNPPDDHTRDYDDVIEMLEMDTTNQVQPPTCSRSSAATSSDNWGYSQTWTSTNTAYIQAAGQ